MGSLGGGLSASVLNSVVMAISQLILGSASPRRAALLAAAGYHYEQVSTNIPEIPPATCPADQVPAYLAGQKAAALVEHYPEGLILAADTAVILEGQIMGKPQDLDGARHMLEALSGHEHQVTTGYCLRYSDYQEQAAVTTAVKFRPLAAAEMDYYLNNYQVLDKAGGYGIQDWIGLVGIEYIQGDYYNVVGLPMCHLKPRLDDWLGWG
jgi:septum formation protein